MSKCSFNSFGDIAMFIKSENEILRNEIRNAVSEIQAKFENCVKEMNLKVNKLTDENALLKSRIDDLEDLVIRHNKSSQLLVRGVPYISDEDVNGIYSNIAKAIGFNEVVPIHVRRLRNMKSNINTINKRTLRSGASNAYSPEPPSVILISFSTIWDKSTFFSKYLQFAKLSQSHIGFNNDARIYMSENLSPKNFNIIRKCGELKREGKISKYFSRDGLVYICYKENAIPVRLLSISDLEIH